MSLNTYQKIGMKELIDLFESKSIKPDYAVDSRNDMECDHKENLNDDKPKNNENGKNVRQLILFYEKMSRNTSADGNSLKTKNNVVNHSLVECGNPKEINKTPEYAEEQRKDGEEVEEQKIFNNEELTVNQPDDQDKLNHEEPSEFSENSSEIRKKSIEEDSIHYETKNENHELSALGEADNDSESEQNQEVSNSVSSDEKVESLKIEIEDSSDDEKIICENTDEIISGRDLSNENNKPEKEDSNKIEKQDVKIENFCVDEMNMDKKDSQDENFLKNIENNEKSSIDVEKFAGEIEKKLINLEPEELKSKEVEPHLEMSLSTVKDEETIAEDCNRETENIEKEVSDLTGEEEKGFSESPIDEETITTDETNTSDEQDIDENVTDERALDEKLTDEKPTDEEKITPTEKDDNKIEVSENKDGVVKKKYFINDEEPFFKPVFSTDENLFTKAQKDASEAILAHKEKNNIFGQICDFFTCGMCCSGSEDNTVEVNPAVYTMIDYLESNHYNHSNLFTTPCTDENYKEIVRVLTNGDNVEFWNYNPYEIVAAIKMYVGKELNGFINTEYSEIILKVLLNKGEEGELIIKQNGKLVMAQDRLKLLIKILNLFKKMNNLNRNKIYYDELVASIAPYFFPLNLCCDVSNDDILKATTLVCDSSDLTKIRIMLGIN
ncbi:hypothetical protein DMUE_1696 [Dictyocoela muelleri]|nr:hypothetical protein DMUE_1696 [Dictyocoela muelleri]